MKTLLFAATLLNATVGFAQTWTQQTSGTTTNLRHVHFVDANTGWAVGENGTVLKTTNGGTAWTSQIIGGSPFLIGCYFVDANTGWVGGTGVYKTTDGGTTWTTQAGPASITKLYFISASTGWAVGGHDGSAPIYGDIFKTTNGGTTWSLQTNNSTWSRFYDVEFGDANTGWAYTESNGLLIKTTDGGATWQPLLSYGTTKSIRGMYFLNQNTGWVVGQTSSSGMVLKSTDGGSQFTDLSAGLQFGLKDVWFVDANLGWATANGGPQGRGVLHSTNGGTSWTFTPLAGSPNLTSMFFVDANNGWAVGDAGHIFKFGSTTGVDTKDNTTPGGFVLSQNYPNPFNPTTNISFAVARLEFVSLKLFDVLGREVATLVNDDTPPGEYNVIFHAAGLASGVYLYRLQSGRLSETKKLIFSK